MFAWWSPPDDTDGIEVAGKRAYPNNSTPPIPDTGNCPNNMNATPVIDRQKGIIYFLPGGRGGGGRGGAGARGGAALGPGGTPSVMNPNLKSVDRPWQPIDRKLAGTVSSYWANFASKGDPNGSGLPTWPAYDATSDVTLGSNDTIGPHPRPDGNRLDFFERVGEAAVSPLTDCGRGPEQTKSPVPGLWPHGRCCA